jgi:K+-sensing histidine kinase KdpD
MVRIEAGKIVSRKKSVNLSELINASCRACKVNADKRGQIIKFSIKTSLQPAKIDPLLFTEALNNTLNNAIGYGPDNSPISLAVEAKGGKYVISVNNIGSVIDESDRGKIFDKFYRGINSYYVDLIGSGLGMHIAKAFVESNGGEIWFNSSQDAGTTFFFTVPR